MIFFNTIKRVFKKVRRIFSLSFEKNHLIKRQKQTGRVNFNIFLNIYRIKSNILEINSFKSIQNIFLIDFLNGSNLNQLYLNFIFMMKIFMQNNIERFFFQKDKLDRL